MTRTQFGRTTILQDRPERAIIGADQPTEGGRVKQALNARETMEILRISRETLAALLESGELQGFVKGKLIRIDRGSVEKLLGRVASTAA